MTKVINNTNQKAFNWIPLWPDNAPGGKIPPRGTETLSEELHIRQTERPEYELHLAEKPNGQGIIVFPGGGYELVAMKNEGAPVARLLNDLGISVMIVKYRIDHENIFDYHFPIPLLDARRAIRTMRFHATQWNINKSEVGVMGFSAGGHLAGLASNLFEETFEAETNDAIDHENPRPSFSILGYPVIDMSHDFKHEGSAKNLTGEIQSVRESCSLQNRVSPKTPPTFIFHSANDEPVPVKNSLVYLEACTTHNVSATLHVFSEGGHGYSLKDTGAHSCWPELLRQWLELKQWNQDPHAL